MPPNVMSRRGVQLCLEETPLIRLAMPIGHLLGETIVCLHLTLIELFKRGGSYLEITKQENYQMLRKEFDIELRTQFDALMSSIGKSGHTPMADLIVVENELSQRFMVGSLIIEAERLRRAGRLDDCRVKMEAAAKLAEFIHRDDFAHDIRLCMPKSLTN